MTEGQCYVSSYREQAVHDGLISSQTAARMIEATDRQMRATEAGAAFVRVPLRGLLEEAGERERHSLRMPESSSAVRV